MIDNHNTFCSTYTINHKTNHQQRKTLEFRQVKTEKARSKAPEKTPEKPVAGLSALHILMELHFSGEWVCSCLFPFLQHRNAAADWSHW